MRTLLIDGDQYLYRACIAVEKEVRWDEDNHVLGSNWKEASELALGGIEKTRRALEGDKLRLAFTKGDSFRKALYPAYKEARKVIRKPMCFPEVRDVVMKEHPSLIIPGLEADDILGIWATRGDLKDFVIVSDDKDLKTIPGKLWHREGTRSVLTEISPAEADAYWLTQTLTGDTADGYPGCPGIGAAKVGKIVGFNETRMTPWTVKAAWPSIVAAYEKAGLTEEDALTQARCARILRNTDWNALTKEVILWQPD